MPDLSAPLTREELGSLREAATGPIGRTIPAAHKAHLLRLGYLKEVPDGHLVTRIGHMRVAKDS